MGFAAGIVPGWMGMLVWAPLLALFGGLVLWLAVLMVVQRLPRRDRAPKAEAVRPVLKPHWRPAYWDADPLTLP